MPHGKLTADKFSREHYFLSIGITYPLIGGAGFEGFLRKSLEDKKITFA
jgi:hypothetical protein